MTPRAHVSGCVTAWLLSTTACGVELDGSSEAKTQLSCADTGAAATAPAGAPRVLLWGDSISQGYGDANGKLCGSGVAALLSDRFDVYVLPYNAQTTDNGLEHVGEWLTVADRGIAPTDWDLIHFNHGLHDTDDFGSTGSPVAAPKVSPEKYRANLVALVDHFRTQTRAKLMWASTTPRPTSDGRAGLIVEYNQIASEVMAQATPPIPTDDLYRFVTENGLRNSSDVHFTTDQTRLLAKHVAGAIRTYWDENSGASP